MTLALRVAWDKRQRPMLDQSCRPRSRLLTSTVRHIDRARRRHRQADARWPEGLRACPKGRAQMFASVSLAPPPHALKDHLLVGPDQVAHQLDVFPQQLLAECCGGL